MPRRSSQSTQVAPFGVADLAVKPILDASKTESITRLMVSPKRLVVIGVCDGCAMEPSRARLRQGPDKRKTLAVQGFFGGSGGGI